MKAKTYARLATLASIASKLLMAFSALFLLRVAAKLDPKDVESLRAFAQANPAVCVTFLVGISAFGVSLMQYRIGRLKLKLDLYDRRFACCQKVVVGALTIFETINNPDEVSHIRVSVLMGIMEATFLFDSDSGIQTKLSEMQTEIEAVGQAIEAIRTGDLGKPRDELQLELRQAGDRLRASTKGLAEKMHPYLSFTML